MSSKLLPGFVSLPVDSVAAAADDGSAVAVSMRVPCEHRSRFAFSPGQYVTVRAVVEGVPVLRPYSVCSAPRELHRSGVLRIGIRRLDDGRFSTFAACQLSPGGILDVLPPRGSFTTAPEPGRTRHYAAVVAGAGITPVLSLITETLATEAASTFSVLYGNRTVRSAMFLDELGDLKNSFAGRFQPFYLFSRESLQAGLSARRLDFRTMRSLLSSPLLPCRIDEWFLCGPSAMVREARLALLQNEVPDSDVKVELFRVGEPRRELPEKTRATPRGTGAALTVQAQGRRTPVRMARGQTVLEAALAARPELPYSCLAGVCATCRAKVVAGSARMRSAGTLTETERARGFILTCQAVAGSARIEVDFDAT